MTNIEYVQNLCDEARCMSGVPEEWCDIVADCHRRMLATGIGFKVDQIKEKFGGLRFYFTVTSDGRDLAYAQLESFVRQAEEAVYRL